MPKSDCQWPCSALPPASREISSRTRSPTLIATLQLCESGEFVVHGPFLKLMINVCPFSSERFTPGSRYVADYRPSLIVAKIRSTPRTRQRSFPKGSIVLLVCLLPRHRPEPTQEVTAR